MNLAIVIVISDALALAVILSVAVSRTLQTSRRSAGLAGAIRPIDIEAFRNLIDPAEELPAAPFAARSVPRGPS
jgi:hypothetical protein